MSLHYEIDLFLYFTDSKNIHSSLLLLRVANRDTYQKLHHSFSLYQLTSIKSSKAGKATEKINSTSSTLHSLQETELAHVTACIVLFIKFDVSAKMPAMYLKHKGRCESVQNQEHGRCKPWKLHQKSGQTRSDVH